jgi:putative membrane protein
VRASRVLLGALAAGQVAYGVVPGRRSPRVTRALVGAFTATSAVEAVEARGARRGLGLLAGAAAVGLAAEWVGVATGRPFGRYAYSDRLGPRVGGVPLLAGAAWAMMARPAWVAAGHAAGTGRPVVRVPLAAAALTAWDVFLDPRMVREGYWTWPGGGRYEAVPATNFLGWWGTGLVLFGAWTALEGAEPADAGDDGALALYAWTWVGEAVANAVVWRRPRVALAGAAAMGAVAVPAIARRLRP